MGLRPQARLTQPRPGLPRRLPLLLLLASGFAGLGYQLVWTQQAALWLGHESTAVLAVVTGFFGGSSVGALVCGPLIERTRRPRAWYVAAELVIASSALLTSLALPVLSSWAQQLTGERPTPLWQWSVAFTFTFLLLLPATAAMGATLPAMERLQTSSSKREPSVGLLYASNTLGALFGVLASALFLIANVGLSRTTWLCASLNVVCSLAAIAAFPAEIEPSARPGSKRRERMPRLTGLLALTGLLGIGYEVLVVRVLSQVTENTVYTFAALLAVYLLGTAAGAATHRRFWSAGRRAETGDRLLGALGAACLLGTASLWTAESSRAAAHELLGDGTWAAVLAEALPAMLAFGLPTFVMGAVFSELCSQAPNAGVSLGRALGVNTLGAAIAPPMFGMWILPSLGAKSALLLVTLGYLALVRWRSWGHPLTWLPAMTALLLLLAAPPLTFVTLPPEGRLVSYQDGVMAAVSVVQDADGVSRLHINNRAQEGSSATGRVDGRQAWLPLLLQTAPQRALFLGLGTGVTASYAAEDPTLRVQVVELLPEVIRASGYFAEAAPEGAAARLQLLAADARRYVRVTPERYDVIVSDNFHPARSGSGSLYTVEHFEAVRARLTREGLFCQWLPLHQLDRETLRSIVRAFLTAYPGGWAMIASGSLETPVLGLVSRADGARLELGQIRARLAHVALPERIKSLGIEDDLALLGSFVAGPASLGRFAGDAALNTDDRPVVAYRAPLATYAPASSPRDRFIALLGELSLEPRELINPGGDETFNPRLAAYWRARDLFVESGRDVRPSARVEEMLAQVREPLLAVLRISPDFRPAYDPLFAMATALAGSNVSGARSLLSELSRLQPSRQEAPRALTLLTPAASSRE